MTDYINTDNLTIGAAPNQGGDYYFRGEIDEVMIFNRSLSAIEMRALYNSTYDQYQHNFTSLDDRDYRVDAFTVDSSGNKNQTFGNDTINTSDPT